MYSILDPDIKKALNLLPPLIIDAALRRVTRLTT